MILTSGCTTAPIPPQKNLDWLIIKSLPPFPNPSNNAATELWEVCRKGMPPKQTRCPGLYAWLAKLKKLEKQLNEYEKVINEEKA